MIDFAWAEILFIGVLALILLGPKELIVVMRTLGKWIGKVRSWSKSWQEHLSNLDEKESDKDGHI